MARGSGWEWRMMRKSSGRVVFTGTTLFSTFLYLSIGKGVGVLSGVVTLSERRKEGDCRNVWNRVEEFGVSASDSLSVPDGSRDFLLFFL